CAGFGLAFGHGLGKFILLTTGEGAAWIQIVGDLGFPAPALFAWLATLAELAGGLLIAFGIWTRVAAVFGAVTMFVASFLEHKLHLHVLSFVGLAPVPDETLERWGDPEMSFLYLLIFVALAILGGGRYSLQRLFRKPRTLFS
ncbi:MAG: DoxX family protein, partial [Thermoanaerobaculia bacterium]|nr:DoxX family protein [Thermoanaerobaculia bacterium]